MERAFAYIEGKIPEKYKYLEEVSGEFKTDKENYDARTRKNIEDSDGRLILVPQVPLPEKIKDGTLLTIEYAKRLLLDRRLPSLYRTFHFSRL